MAQNKKQHYVPQFLLRNFSDDGNVVYIYNIVHRKSFRSKIKDVCQEKYFYGSEVELEQNLGKIEGKQAYILRKLIENLSFYFLEEKERYYWLMFILMQHARTEGSLKRCDETFRFFYDEKGKPLLKESSHLKEKGITPEFIDSTTIKMNKPHLHSMSIGMMGVELISDLFPIILINKTDKPFVASDDLICLYNYVKFKNFGTLGLQSPGLQIYCPLNQNIIFLLVDPEFYHLNLNKNQNGTGIVYVEKTIDVNAINKLQILNCHQNIIFSSQIYENYVRELHLEVEQLLCEKNIEYVPLNSKIPTGYRLQLSFIRLNREMRNKYKRRVKEIIKNNENIGLCRTPHVCEMVRELISKNYQEAEDKLKQERK